MNWLEAFQALSERKMVTDSRGTQYRIRNSEFQYRDKGCDRWEVSIQAIDSWINNEYELAIDYPLSFIEAMNEIQKGNKVECKKNPGTLVYLDKYGNVICSTVFGKQTASFYVYEVRAKWRVVEEEE